MKKKKFIAPLFVFGLLFAGSTALAFDGGFHGLSDTALSGFSSGQQDAIQKSFEVRQAAHEEAQKILEDAGVSMEDLMKAREADMKARKEQMDEIFTNNDYQGFLELMKDKPFGQDITESQFQVLVKAHALAESGDREAARQLLEDAGIKGPFMGGHGHGPRMGMGKGE